MNKLNQERLSLVRRLKDEMKNDDSLFEGIEGYDNNKLKRMAMASTLCLNFDDDKIHWKFMFGEDNVEFLQECEGEVKEEFDKLRAETIQKVNDYNETKEESEKLTPSEIRINNRTGFVSVRFKEQE